MLKCTGGCVITVFHAKCAKTVRNKIGIGLNERKFNGCLADKVSSQMYHNIVTRCHSPQKRLLDISNGNIH